MVVLHMVLRIPRLQQVDGQTVDIVAEHNRVVSEHGRVAIAKHGRPPATDRAEILNQQIHGHQVTRLYVVCRREDGGFDVFRSKLVGILFPGDRSAWNQAPRPAYYSRMMQQPTVLFLADEKLSPSRLEHLTIDSSGKRLAETIGRCSTSLFTVHESASR